MARCIYVLLVFIALNNALTVLEPPELAGFYNSPWIRRYGNNQINTSEPIRSRLAATFNDRAGPAEGNIILSCFIGHGTTEDQIRSQIGRGIIGYVNCARFSSFPGILERLRDGSDISDINIPVWDVSYKDFQKVINYMQSDADNITVVIEIGFDDPNPWEEAYNSAAFPVMSAVLGSYALVVSILAAWKLSTFIRAFGPERSIPQVCLWIELFANLERAIFVAVDPWFSRAIFPLAASHMLYTISVPAIPATSLLITLYWKELLTKQKSKTVTFLDKAQIPFYVVVSFIWAFEFTIAILRGLGDGPLSTLIIVLSVFYGVVLSFTSIFFFYYGHTLMKTLNSTQNRVQTEKTKSKYKAIKLLYASAAFQLGIILYLIFQATDYAFYPYGLVAGDTFGFVMFLSTSLFKVLAFSIPISKKSSSGDGNARRPSSVSLPKAVSTARLRAGSATSVTSTANTPLQQLSQATETHRSVELESPLKAEGANINEGEVAITMPDPKTTVADEPSASDDKTSASESDESGTNSHNNDEESVNSNI